MTMGNLGYQLQHQFPADAIITSGVYPILETRNGIVYGVTALTAVASLSALCETRGVRFAPNCLILVVNSVAAANSVRMVINTGVATAPTFTAVLTI